MATRLLPAAALVAAASASVALDLDNHSVDVGARFNRFVSVFAKEYASDAHQASAAAAFAENGRVIAVHNAGDHSYTPGHDEFSDTTCRD